MFSGTCLGHVRYFATRQEMSRTSGQVPASFHQRYVSCTHRLSGEGRKDYQMSQQQDPYQQLRQQLGSTMPGRTWKKTARVSPAQVDENTDLEMVQETFLDPTTLRYITREQSQHYLLACGCRVSTPAHIRGVCPACARSLRVRLSGRMRLICDQHVMCLRCWTKRHRKLYGGGLWRTVLAVVLWPLFDTDYEGTTEPLASPPTTSAPGDPDAKPH